MDEVLKPADLLDRGREYARSSWGSCPGRTATQNWLPRWLKPSPKAVGFVELYLPRLAFLVDRCPNQLVSSTGIEGLREAEGLKMGEGSSCPDI